MLFSARNHLGDLLGVGLRRCDLRRPSVLPQCLGGHQMVHCAFILTRSSHGRITHEERNLLFSPLYVDKTVCCLLISNLGLLPALSLAKISSGLNAFEINGIQEPKLTPG